MLSPHELAVLLLIKSASEAIDLEPADLAVLLQQHLVRREQSVNGIERLALTPAGQWVVSAVMTSAITRTQRAADPVSPE